MERLDIGHHKVIALVLAVLVFVIGVFVGVKILGASGLEGLLVIVFALLLLIMSVALLLLMKLVHVRDDLATEKAGVRVRVRK